MQPRKAFSTGLTGLKSEIIQPEEVIYNLSALIYWPGFLIDKIKYDH